MLLATDTKSGSISTEPLVPVAEVISVVDNEPANNEHVEDAENACLCCALVYGILNFFKDWQIAESL